MTIYRLLFSIALFTIVSVAGAQESAETEKFDYAKYRGVRKMIEGHKYIMEPRFSGPMKDLQEINRASQKAFSSVAHPAAAYKGKGLAALPSWQVVGGHQVSSGFNSSGRARDVAFGPGNVVYLATAGGGLWKTEDITGGGSNNPTWVPLTDRLPTTSSGSVAVDPSNPNVVYYGTGEKSPDGADPSIVVTGLGLGDGLYKSYDGGLNWTKIAGVGLTGDRISEVLIDPTNPQTIYVACDDSRATSGSDTSGGVIKSTDGGATWQHSNLRGFAVLYLAMDIKEPNRLYASGFGKIFRTSDGGNTWEQITSGITGSFGRTAIDVSQDKPNVLYASVAVTSQGTQLSTNGLYVSNDYGSTWRELNPGPANSEANNYLFQQGWFANAVAAYPNNHRIAIAAGLHVVRTTDSGKALSMIGKAQDDLHADQHAIVYNGPSNLYICHDGGLSYSKSNGNSWINTVNNGLSTLEFVGVDADKDFTFVLGGTQDNGTNRALVGETSFTESLGGDGGRTWISPINSDICYTTQYEEQFFRSLNGGKTIGGWEKITVTSACPFYPRYDANATGEIIALGANAKVVVSMNGGVDGFAQKSTQNIPNARAIKVFPSDATYMWAGSGTGLWRSTDMGVNFTRTIVTNAGTITDIDVDPNNPMNLWICSQGYGGSTHNVYKSTDGGVTVTPIPNFPANLGANAIVHQHSHGKNRIIVGTDRGVLFTDDEGENWFALTDGMPNVPVNSLRIRGTNDDKLLAGTYGRGMYWMDLEGLSSVDGEEKRPDAKINFISTHPNPVTGGKSTITFEMKEAGLLTSTLLDVMGREVKILEKNNFAPGTSQFEFTTDGLAAGTYIVLLSANGTTVSQRIVVQ